MVLAMLVERHYEDEALIALMESDRVHTDPHLPSCSSCADKLESFRMIADALEEREVWDSRGLSEEPVHSTITALRSFADRMTFEDLQAEAILLELLAGPREEWMSRLRHRPEWRTAGVVRKLIDGIHAAIMTMPPDALEMTMLSTEIADHLDPTTFASDTVMRLRGSAWRDRAYALFYVGRFAESVSATERAELNFQACVIDEYDRARVSVVRALSLRAMEDLPTAMGEVRRSGDVFVTFGDLNRLASARIAESHLLFSRGDYEKARLLLEPLEVRLRSEDDAKTYATVLGNLGYCYSKLGRIEEALSRYEASAALHVELGIVTEVTRLRWAIATILAEAGRHDEALRRFRELQRTFTELSMTSEAALVSLDAAELLLVRQEFSAVEDICRAAMRSFETAGIPYTARALTALAFIQEAARAKTASPVLVKHVREYLRCLPRDGQLLFAPPPPEAPWPNSR
ncbi:MAG: tetratricopeptide repeat protein [Acidobacteriota bacterium]